MARDGHINAAGGFLRALNQSARAGGQAVGTTSLPVKELLLLLVERPRVTGEIADELVVSEAIVAQAVNNLEGLGLVEVSSTGEGDRSTLTALGQEVAQQQGGG